MLINARDHQIILSVARWNQLATNQIRKLHFQDVASATPMYRTLERLVERRYLSKLERRMVGGSGAGSGQYVYQLGVQGWQLIGGKGQYYPRRTASYHTLEIVDAYLHVADAERSGRFRIDAVSHEPDSWMVIAGADLRPDLYLEVSDLMQRRTMTLWLEVDLGTERQKAIREKINRYSHAYEHASESELSVFPAIIFIAPDERRERELRWIVESQPEDVQRLFVVSSSSEWASLLFA